MGSKEWKLKAEAALLRCFEDLSSKIVMTDSGAFGSEFLT